MSMLKFSNVFLKRCACRLCDMSVAQHHGIRSAAREQEVSRCGSADEYMYERSEEPGNMMLRVKYLDDSYPAAR
jgi:hypothetical protein